MPLDRKYGKVKTQLQSFPNDDEPVFIIRAKDKAAVPSVLAYAIHAFDVGASPEFILDVIASAKRFMDWQQAKGAKVPD